MTAHAPNGTWQSWFDTYGSKLLLYARQWSSSTADAEDILQDAFIRFWRSPHRNDADAHVQLFAMVRRAGLDHLRRHNRRLARERRAAEPEEATAWFAPPMERAEQAAAVQQALSKLPVDQREVLVLKIWGELTFDQIARSLDISPHTAASRYRYGLRTLKRHLATLHP